MTTPDPTPLTPESEALLAEVHGTSMALTVFPARLTAIEAAVTARVLADVVPDFVSLNESYEAGKQDAMADVAARLPEALRDEFQHFVNNPPGINWQGKAKRILANLTGGPR